MKALQLLVAALNVGAALSLKEFPFKVRKVINETVNEGPELRIYGGAEATEGQFPYMIFALMKHMDETITQCSASLFSTSWVLLAAHCVDLKGLRPNNIILVGGKAKLSSYIKARINTRFDLPINEEQLGVQERRAQSFFIHSKYDRETLYHDVALIKVSEPFSLKTISISEDQITSKRSCLVLGWGLTRGNLQNYKLNYLSNKMVSTTKVGCGYKFKGPFICLVPDNRGICQGDSGSPLVCDGKVWGVASHLLSDNPMPDCGDSVEEYFSELYYDLDWIRSIYNSGNLSNMIYKKSLFLCVASSLWFFAKM